MTVTLRYTEAIFRQAIVLYLQRCLRRQWPIGVLLPVSVSLAFFTGSTWLQAFVCVPLLALPAMFALGYWLRIRQSLDRLRLLNGGQVIFSVDDEGPTIESSIGKSESRWKIYTDLWEFPGYHLLFYGQSQFITLPRNQVPPEMITFIRQKLAAQPQTKS